MIVSADIGGTNAVLGLFRLTPSGTLTKLLQRTYRSAEYESVDDVLERFLEPYADRGDDWTASLGLAGPTAGDTAHLTNLGWTVQRTALKERFRFRDVALLNDLEATAHALFYPKSDDLISLTPGLEPNPVEDLCCRAVVAAGTGLGFALLPPKDSRSQSPFPSEGGHADFAPQDQAESELAHYLRQRYGHATWEHVVSGPGFLNLYQFLRRNTGLPASNPVARLIEEEPSQAPATISAAGLERTCPLCEEVVRWFVRLYGSVAGNFALTTFSRGGVYLAGGIAPRLISQLMQPEFSEAFTNKHEMKSQLAAIRVFVVNNSNTALHGAAIHAARSLGTAPKDVAVDGT